MPSAPDRPSISVTQIAASALAASSAAFAASYLGVAGTIIGAAVASVVATVASTMYAASLHHSTAAVRRRAQLGVRPAGDAEPEADHPTWRRTALTAAAVLTITLGSVTGVEAVLGKPLSGLLGGSDSSGTTLGSAVSPHSRGTAKTRTPATRTPKQPASPASTPTASPTDEPTDGPTSKPTDQPTSGPTSSPTDSPTDQPTTPEPTQTPTAAP